MIRQSLLAFKAIKEADKMNVYYCEKYNVVYSRAQLEELRTMGMDMKIDEVNQMVEFI